IAARRGLKREDALIPDHGDLTVGAGPWVAVRNGRQVAKAPRSRTDIVIPAVRHHAKGERTSFSKCQEFTDNGSQGRWFPQTRFAAKDAGPEFDANQPRWQIGADTQVT